MFANPKKLSRLDILQFVKGSCLQPVGELGGMLPEHLVDNVVEIKADRCHGHEAFRFIAEHGI